MKEWTLQDIQNIPEMRIWLFFLGLLFWLEIFILSHFIEIHWVVVALVWLFWLISTRAEMPYFLVERIDESGNLVGYKLVRGHLLKQFHYQYMMFHDMIVVTGPYYGETEKSLKDMILNKWKDKIADYYLHEIYMGQKQFGKVEDKDVFTLSIEVTSTGDMEPLDEKYDNDKDVVE